MAKQSEIQYIRLYTDGSTARNVDFSPPRKKSKTRLPKAHRQQKLRIKLDPIAVCGTVVAGILLVFMIVGVVQLGQAQREVQQANQYVIQLQEQNAALQSSYEAGYDLEDIEKMALALGMVPEEQVRHVMVQVETPNPEPEVSWWQSVTTFLAELFA